MAMGLNLTFIGIFQANKYGLVCHMNAEQYPHIDCLLFCNSKFILKEMLAKCIRSLIYNYSCVPTPSWETACPFVSLCVFHIHTSYQSGILGLGGGTGSARRKCIIS